MAFRIDCNITDLKYKKQFRVDRGYNSKCFTSAKAAIQDKDAVRHAMNQRQGKLDVMLCVDAMRVTDGLLYNASNGKFSGFSMDESEIPELVAAMSKRSAAQIVSPETNTAPQKSTGNETLALSKYLVQTLFMSIISDDTFLGPHFEVANELSNYQLGAMLRKVVVEADQYGFALWRSCVMRRTATCR